VDVAKSYTLDFKMELGQVAEVVQVEAGRARGTANHGRNRWQRPPERGDSALSGADSPGNELLTLQPGATPTGRSPAREAIRAVFTLDGIDVTNNSVGGLGTFAFLPIDSIDEFRVSVANPMPSTAAARLGQVSFGEAARAPTSIMARFIGYHQNDELNANSWDNNRLKLTNPELKDQPVWGPRRWSTAIPVA